MIPPVSNNATGNSYEFSKEENVVDEFLNEYFTPLGRALLARDLTRVESLLEEGMTIDQTSPEDRTPCNPLCDPLGLYFSNFNNVKPNLDLLKLILFNGAPVHSLTSKTVYHIGVFATVEELRLLLDQGLDPGYSYNRDISLLDLAVASAEKKNLFQADADSYLKVVLLLEWLSNPIVCHNNLGQNYLFRVSDPVLMSLLCKRGVDVNAKAYLHRPYKWEKRSWVKEKGSPIELAYTKEMVEVLCLYGADKSKSPYTKGSTVHQEALRRNESVLNSPIGVEGLLTAFKQKDYRAFIALLGNGVDVNQRRSQENCWTCLHELFSEMTFRSLCSGSDYLKSVYEFEPRLINMLIKHGAKPLKDVYGRTPLMCVPRHAPEDFFSGQVLKTYADFEANYYGLDPKKYRKNILQIRNEFFFGMDGWYNCTFVPPEHRWLFNQFWESFEHDVEFKPCKPAV